MKNLFWKTTDTTRNLIETPFPSENILEKYIFDNQDLLDDVYIIYRQIRTGNKQGIPDMLGVDQDARICIIELKNHTAGEDILPQALSYAIWAETNPDSIKAIWLESKLKPEDIEVDWDNIDLRVILIAPDFKSTVPRMAGKMGYPIELLKINRYCHEDNEFLLIDQVEEEIKPKATSTEGITTWDWEYYETEHGKEATAQFRKVVDEIQKLVLKKNWQLLYNLNKYYTGFKYGNKVVFSVGWASTFKLQLNIKVPEESAVNFKGKYWEFQKYNKNFKQMVFKPIDPNKVLVNELEDFFVEAHKRITG
jgi:hypothetical protein